MIAPTCLENRTHDHCLGIGSECYCSCCHFLELTTLEAVLNYQHLFRTKRFLFVSGWVGINPDFVAKKKFAGMYCTNARACRYGWRYSMCSRGEVASLGCVEGGGGRWPAPPSVCPTPLLPSLSGAGPVPLSSSSVGDLTAANNCT